MFSYSDYLTCPEEERWELIEGVPHTLPPAPPTLHQTICAALIARLRFALQGRQGRILAAPFDRRLPERDEAVEQIRTVVQPDLWKLSLRPRLRSTRFGK